MKNIRPLFSTIVDPSEYEVDRQMEEWLKDANKHQACFHEIDVGKMWGLYLSWKRQQERIAELESKLGVCKRGHVGQFVTDDKGSTYCYACAVGTGK